MALKSGAVELDVQTRSLVIDGLLKIFTVNGAQKWTPQLHQVSRIWLHLAYTFSAAIVQSVSSSNRFATVRCAAQSCIHSGPKASGIQDHGQIS